MCRIQLQKKKNGVKKCLEIREGCGKSKWKFKMAFAIRRPTPPPLNGTNFQTFFYPTFFLLQLNPTYMKRILHFKISLLSPLIIGQPNLECN